MKKRRATRNRKAEVNVPFPVMLANVLVLMAVVGLCYVWLCARCEQLGQEIKQLEIQQVQTRRQLISEEQRWAARLAPANFERILRQHGLAMSMPDERQIVRVRSRHSATQNPMLVYKN